MLLRVLPRKLRAWVSTNPPAAEGALVDSGGANPDYLQLGAGGFIDYPAAAGGEAVHIQIQGALRVAVATTATAHRGASNDCHAQALGFMGT